MPSNENEFISSGEISADVNSFKYRRASEIGSTTRESNDSKKQHGKTTREEAVKEVREYLINKYQDEYANITDDKQAYKKIEKAIVEYVKNKGIQIEGVEENYEAVAKEIRLDLLDYSVLTELIFDYDRAKDKKIEEIEVNDYNDIRIVVGGKPHLTNLSFNNPDQAIRIAEKIVRNSMTTSVLKEDSPLVRARLGNNIRVSILRSPIARRANDIHNPVVHMTIRKQANEVIVKEKLLKWGTINEYGDSLLELIVNSGISMAYYGGTGCGKTGTMGSYVHRVDSDKRGITIAEIDEMNAREVDENGNPINRFLMWEIKEGIMTLRALVNTSLTFTPEILVIQETKGEEVVDVLTASQTDHQVLTTLHAKDKNVFGKRILSMYKESGSDLEDELILDLVSDAFGVIVQMKKLDDGSRKIIDISELQSYDKKEKKFVTRTLVEYVIDRTYFVPATDENGTPVIDRRTKKPKMRQVIEGRHVIRNTISEKLKREMLFNGASSEDLARFTNIESLKKEADYEPVAEDKK